MAESRFFVSIQDLEHVKLHVWEMERLVEDMRTEKNPQVERLERLLKRFVATDPNKDRA